MKNKLIIMASIFSTTLAVDINEQLLVDWARKSSYSKSRIELGKLQALNEEKKFNENFIYNFGSELSYVNTEEKPFTNFAPVTTPVKNFEVRLEKATRRGIGLETRAFSNQLTNNFYKHGTTSGVGIRIKADLYKDILGSLTKKQEKSLSLQKKIAIEEAKINEQAFVSNVRKLYWSLVSVNESLNISKALLETAKKLERDTGARFKSKIADKDELTRIRSQVQTRQGQIYILEYDRSNIIKQIRNLFPDQLNEKTVKLAPYDIEQTVKDVLACSAKISSKAKIPYEDTNYDDILAYLESNLTTQLAINEKHDDPEVALMADATYLGKDFGYSESIDNFTDDSQAGITLGLTVNIPLGKEKKDTKAIQKEILTKTNIAKYKEIQGRLGAFHTETVNSINVLYKVIDAQERNTKLLNETFKISNGKFKQARINARNLLQDEDSLLQSNLNEINTKYNVIATIIDYFSVYGSTACIINI